MRNLPKIPISDFAGVNFVKSTLSVDHEYGKCRHIHLGRRDFNEGLKK